MIGGYRLIALAVALFAGAVAMAGGAMGKSHDSYAAGAILMVVSGIWLVAELIRSYTEKK